MKLNAVMRYTYLFGWVFLIVGVVYRVGLFAVGSNVEYQLGVAPRSLLLMSGLLFVICMTTGIYAQSGAAPGKG